MDTVVGAADPGSNQATTAPGGPEPDPDESVPPAAAHATVEGQLRASRSEVPRTVTTLQPEIFVGEPAATTPSEPEEESTNPAATQ